MKQEKKELLNKWLNELNKKQMKDALELCIKRLCDYEDMNIGINDDSKKIEVYDRNSGENIIN